MKVFKKIDDVGKNITELNNSNAERAQSIPESPFEVVDIDEASTHR
jgi:hypothetical protein